MGMSEYGVYPEMSIFMGKRMIYQWIWGCPKKTKKSMSETAPASQHHIDQNQPKENQHSQDNQAYRQKDHETQQDDSKWIVTTTATTPAGGKHRKNKISDDGMCIYLGSSFMVGKDQI